MPWAATDKVNIIRFLGFSATQSSLDLVQTRMDEVGSLGFADLGAEYVAELVTLTAEIKKATRQLTAGVQTQFDADDNPVEYRLGEPIRTLREQGTNYTYLLSELLGLSVVRDTFQLRVFPKGGVLRS
jgi:hypothetical protein